MTQIRSRRPSRRGLVRELCEELVQKLSRGFVMDELIQFGESRLNGHGLERKHYNQAVASLVQTEDLVIVRKRLGGGAGGTNVYAPADVPLTGEAELPRTWLEQVFDAFCVIWDARVEAAEATSTLPEPLTTGVVRSWMKEADSPHENLKDPQLLVNALRQLAVRSEPLLRKISVPGQRQMFWVPIAVEEHQVALESTYATISDRMVEALDRAQRRIGLPAVTVNEVQDQIDADSALRPTGESKVYQILSDLSRDTLAGPNGDRIPRAEQRVHRAGIVAGRTYFSSADPEEWNGFIALREAQATWDDLGFEPRRDGIQNCPLPYVALGRSRLLQEELEEFREAVENVDASSLPMGLEGELARLKIRVAAAASEMEDWKRDIHPVGVPDSVMREVPGLTAGQLGELLEPLYPKAQAAEGASDLVPLLARAIRRIPNPDFERRFARDESVAAEHLFDAVDTRMEAAIRWGGPTACLHGNQARATLGILRDVRFPLLDLSSPHLEHRLLAVACLAFLGGPEAIDAIRDLVTADVEPGVRVSAAWAYGFAGGPDADELLEELAAWDEHRTTRDFVTRARQRGEVGWWGI